MNASRIAKASSFDVDAHLAFSPSPSLTLIVHHEMDVTKAIVAVDHHRVDLLRDAVWTVDGKEIQEIPIRNVPWMNLPVIFDPRFDFSIKPRRTSGQIPRPYTSWDFSGGALREMQTHATSPTDLPCAANAVVVMCRSGMDPWHSAYRTFVAMARQSRGVAHDIVVMNPEGEVQNVDPSVCPPWLRFEASYALNFRILAGRAFGEALRRDREKMDDGRRVYRSFFEGSRIVAHPMFLQVLYAMRANEGSMTDDVTSHATGTWRGTGKHEAASSREVGVDQALEEAMRFRLAAPTHQGWSLTPCGRTFLDLLHPDCEDPDIVLRWRGKADEETRTALDTYLVKFFSKLKNRVSRLPA
jgi:hypothetical protein